MRGAGGAAEELAGRGVRTGGAPGVSISSTLPGVEEREEEGDVGPSSAGPQQKLGPGSSSTLASMQPMPHALAAPAIRAPRAATAVESRRR